MDVGEEVAGDECLAVVHTDRIVIKRRLEENGEVLAVLGMSLHTAKGWCLENF